MLIGTRDPEKLTPELDYTDVARYWRSATPSILGPYMMDGFGFPAGAGQFRFRAEKRIVSRLIHQASRQGTVLDLGSGIGHWAEFFARQFTNVVAIEASQPLYQALEARCRSLANVKTLHEDVLLFQPGPSYEVVFTGGLLMYLNDADVVGLLKKLRPCLGPSSLIICRETTVRSGTVTRGGEYHAVYRSVPIYEHIFQKSGLETVSVESNVPYILMQMGCELIKRWKSLVPPKAQFISVLGRLTYLALRLGNPWITLVPGALGRAFPELTNHFFVLRLPDGSRSESAGAIRS